MAAANMSQDRPLGQRSFSSDDITSAPHNYGLSLLPLPPLPSQGQMPFRSLRTRRAHQQLSLPLHLRRHTAMEDDSWIQSISDVEDWSYRSRAFLHGLPRVESLPSTQESSSYPSNGHHTSNEALNAVMPNQFYNGQRAAAHNTPSSFGNSPLWPAVHHQLDLDGIPSAPMTATWPSHGYSALPNTSSSIPTTPATYGTHQSQPHDQASRVMPHLNTPPVSAASFSNQSGNDDFPKPQLKVDTGSHGYFKENGSIIMNKWFNNTTTQIAPPQLYNVPPPTSHSSQESLNNNGGPSSAKRLRMSPPRLRSASSDLSSHISFRNVADYSSQSPPHAEPAARKRLPNNAHSSPTPLGYPDGIGSGSQDSPSVATSVGHSFYESDSNYGSSSAQSSQPSRLPSPALSDANRSSQNKFLVEARASGMSYREIRIKGGFTEAESTLRGRHRTLTKDKESRVRKPEWTDTDIELLRKAVRAHTRGNLRTGKTSWKKVAGYITDNGGSYSFGFATCHNKWKELQPPSKRR